MRILKTLYLIYQHRLTIGLPEVVAESLAKITCIASFFFKKKMDTVSLNGRMSG